MLEKDLVIRVVRLDAAEDPFLDEYSLCLIRIAAAASTRPSIELT